MAIRRASCQLSPGAACISAAIARNAAGRNDLHLTHVFHFCHLHGEKPHVWIKGLRPEPRPVCAVSAIINQVADWPSQLFPREVVAGGGMAGGGRGGGLQVSSI